MIRKQKLTDEIFSRIDKLNELFDRDERVCFAYLFGGLAHGVAKPLSDIDIALFLSPGVSAADAKLDLLGELTDLLGTDEMDLVILNTAPISLAGRILEKRRIISDKQPFLRHVFESRVMREFFDFRRREQDILYRRFA
jgi:predicted nucleotidyltransferase